MVVEDFGRGHFASCSNDVAADGSPKLVGNQRQAFDAKHALEDGGTGKPPRGGLAASEVGLVERIEAVLDHVQSELLHQIKRCFERAAG